ncbi:MULTISPECIES: sacsin N-terminal ATP-binding-like domain-containing protein [unclassified Streptomyces]|uniref:Molecular chaperone Hsp90 n=1 Tax=Streptomyces sp. NBC_00119 TaxID=2975659 RepID=A0AAU1UNN4_9ACTN|nr:MULTISPECIES: molecular chaperone Hsp90 [unclassified Streptomyces]MCX4644741.1 molecular chaperone Hsp90 [Streptomyces sp. NBC_01446]MCX5326604.1 molecular chaperone Hsp90 [Streptomyces sp. NBC_00120]
MSKIVRPAAEGMDPFGTARLRRGVLDAWAGSPARFREDANAEEDLALGGYRDRLVVELAQNAADAAARAGVPGRFSLTLRDGVLVAANTGAPLDAAGVESLSTLRASAKREQGDGAVGRFGVGFAAVLAVTDEPAVVGRTGGVRWSLAEARGLAADTARHSPGLGDELRRRDGHVPLLRLPFAAEGSAPDPYETVVILPLRDAAAEALAARLIDAIDDTLLLALPGLDEVVVETGSGTRILRRRTDGPYVAVDDEREDAASGGRESVTTRWRVLVRNGPLEAALLADRPLEERLRPHWSVTWAVPVDTDGAPEPPRSAPVLHAPTPSDEPLGVPALLIASFPLDTTRRHAAPGPLTDFLVERAADAYAELLAGWRPVSTAVLGLVPGPLGRGELDGSLRGAILARLPRTAFLPPALPRTKDDADGLPETLRPREAEVVEGAGAETVRVLAEVLPSLLPAGLERRVELRTLEVARVPLTEAVDRLAGLEKEPGWWRRLYDSLAGVDPDRLTGLPVPLAGGRTTIGPRQVLLPMPDATPGEALARLGLKVAHVDAAHPLLEKLGALPATPRAVLTTPQVRAAVAGSLDDDVWSLDDDGPVGVDELAELVLTLVRDANLEPGDEPWLGALALPDDEGELAPAGELVLPGSPFAQVVREGELAMVDGDLAERWGEQPLAACGVLAGFALVRAADVVLDPDELDPRDGDFAEPDDAGLLDAVDVWCEDVLDRLPDTPVPPVATELVAVRDLDLVDDDRWPQALALLSRPPLRDALTQPVRVLLPDGTHEIVRPYTAWWLRDHPVLDGRRPAGLRAAGGDPLLAGLYDPADATGFEDEQVLRALGVRTSVAALLDEPGGAAELLDRLADPEREVGAAQLHALYGALADLDPEQVTLPDELRAVVDGEVRVVDAADAVVADAPDLLPLAGGLALLPVSPGRAADLADLFQVRRLSTTADAGVTQEGAEHPVPESVRTLLGPATPQRYVEHEELFVAGVEVDWRRTSEGTVHASTLEGVAAGLAWAAGQWPRRFEVAALLEDPSRTAELARDRWFD